MTYDADKARAALAAFMTANPSLNYFKWETESGVAERLLHKFVVGITSSLGPKTYAKLAAGASRILKRDVSVAELRGEIDPVRNIFILAVIGANGAVVAVNPADARPVPTPAGMVECRAIGVTGDAGAPKFDDGDVLFVQPPVPPADRHIGRAAIVTVKGGQTALKRIARGPHPGRYDLYGIADGGAPQQDLELQSVESIRWILRKV